MRFLRSLLKYGAVALGVLLLVCACIILFFSSALLNTFGKPLAIDAFSRAAPGYGLQLGEMRYDLGKNRLTCELVTVRALDSSFDCRVRDASVAGIDWIALLRGRSAVADRVYAGAVIDVRDAVFTFSEAQQILRLGACHLSVPSAELTARQVEYDQLLRDEQYFEASRFRRTRYRFTIPVLRMTGLDCRTALQGRGFHATSVALHEPAVEILVNMDKPYDAQSALPLMPNEALASIRTAVAVDSVTVVSGRILYCEQYRAGGAPGTITFTNVNACARRVRNHATPPDTAFIHVSGVFLHAGVMEVDLALPLTENDFSMRYSGSLSRMNASALNAFLEAGEHRRITAGALHSAAFRVDVRSGRAAGFVRLAYSGLRVSVLDKNTGSARGFMNRLSTFIGRMFIIRGTNLPDAHGRMKIGSVRYTRKKDDYFFQYLWFAVRGGVGDVIGF